METEHLLEGKIFKHQILAGWLGMTLGRTFRGKIATLAAGSLHQLWRGSQKLCFRRSSCPYSFFPLTSQVSDTTGENGASLPHLGQEFTASVLRMDLKGDVHLQTHCMPQQLGCELGIILPESPHFPTLRTLTECTEGVSQQLKDSPLQSSSGQSPISNSSPSKTWWDHTFPLLVRPFPTSYFGQ